MKKYRIKSTGDYAHAPQYQRKFLWFTWWCYFEDVGNDGVISPVIYAYKEGAEKFIEMQKQETTYDYC